MTDDKAEETEQRDPQDTEGPLDLSGFETMQQTFGKGRNARVVLTGKAVSLKQLVELSR